MSIVPKNATDTEDGAVAPCQPRLQVLVRRRELEARPPSDAWSETLCYQRPSEGASISLAAEDGLRRGMAVLPQVGIEALGPVLCSMATRADSGNLPRGIHI